MDLKWFSASKYIYLTDQTVQNIWARSGTGPKGNGPEMERARNGTGPKWLLARNGTVRHEMGWARNGTGSKWDGPEMGRARNGTGIKRVPFEWSCTSSGRAISGQIFQAGQLRPSNSGRATQAGASSGPSQFRPSCPKSGRCHFRPVPFPPTLLNCSSRTRHDLGWARNRSGPKWNSRVRNGTGPIGDGRTGPKWPARNGFARNGRARNGIHPLLTPKS